MIIGVPKEIKKSEHRVGLVPSSVKELVSNGHEVWVETGAGQGINFSDDVYAEAGAKIASSAQDIFEKADMIIKVKEPQPAECRMLREDQVLFTYLHLAADPQQTRGLMESGCVAIAYETVTAETGRGLPLLQPMSEIAGRLSTQVGAYHMQKHKGGTGRLIGGSPGVKPAEVVIIGGGVSGFHAAQMAVGLGASVTIADRSFERVRFLNEYFQNKATVLLTSSGISEEHLLSANLVIGAVLIPGASAPTLITKDMLSSMIPGAVLVDISIDQGGCFETSKPTTHDDPTYIVDNIVHYCVANMPGAVPLTSALALNDAILPYALRLANAGWQETLLADENFRNGLNVCKGEITHKGVAESLDLDYNPEPKALAA